MLLFKFGKTISLSYNTFSVNQPLDEEKILWPDLYDRKRLQFPWKQQSLYSGLMHTLLIYSCCSALSKEPKLVIALL